MQKINIIGIAPFEGMKIAMENVAKSFDSISFQAYTGDLMDGVQIAKNLDLNQVNVIISRGGTALLLKKLLPVPVIEIDISVYDIMRAIRLSTHYKGKVALVGFPNITERAKVLKDLLDLDIDILSIDSKESTERVLIDLKKHSYEVVIGDQITSAITRKIGLNAILITSVEESITKALEQATTIGKIRTDTNQQTILLREITEKSPSDVLILNKNIGELSSFSSSKIPKPLRSIVIEKLDETGGTQLPSFKERYNGKIYTITHEIVHVINKKYHLIYFMATKITQPKSLAITQVERNIYENEYVDSFYNSSHSVGGYKKEILRLAKARNPILIIGEFGTGKDKVAQIIYENCVHNKKLWEIDCQVITKTELKNLFTAFDSIFQDEGVTIHLKNIQEFSINQWKQFNEFSQNSLLSNRNKLIFSYVIGSDIGIAQKHILSTNKNILQYRTPSLRERKADLASIATLYINDYNNQYGTNIIGFEPAALKLLINYEWPENLTQFRRVLKQLVIQSSGSYIQTNEVARQLRNEQISIPSTSTSPIPLDRTLEEINYDIVTRVIAEEKGNQTKAAERLGISRSTLWRMIKKFET